MLTVPYSACVSGTLLRLCLRYPTPPVLTVLYPACAFGTLQSCCLSFCVFYRFCGFVDEDWSEEEGSGDEDPAEIPHNRPAVVVFDSNEGVGVLQRASEVFMDSTFATAPSPFLQLFFIMTKEDEKPTVPVVCALTSKRVSASFTGPTPRV